MKYSEIVEVYEELSKTTKRLEKVDILARFLKKLYKADDKEWIYLLRGRVLADYDSREFGISRQLVMKIICKASGASASEVNKEFNKIGDLGEVAEHFLKNKKQSTLYHSHLTIEKVFENLRRLFELSGKGSVDKKNTIVAELLTSANGKEAKWITRTLLSDLRIGVADSTLRDSLAEAFFPDEKAEMAEKIQSVYDLSNDFAEIFSAATKGKKALDKISIIPGKALNVMLPVKVTEISEAFRICAGSDGKVAVEHKYDGFRVVITKQGNEVKLFTRRLENVTNQFPDIVETIKKHVKANDFIIDSEAVGYDPKTKRYKPFEYISQRIKRKYDIDKLIKQLPVEINAFDILYLNGESLVELPFIKRRKMLESLIKPEHFKIKPAVQLITNNETEAMHFYKEALKIGEEGIMVKKLDAPYQPGRRVGHMVKMKPVANDLDLVITAAEHGTGKRAGWLTSFIVACRNNGELLDVGKVSSGLKEKEAETGDEESGTSYLEMTKLLKPLVLSEKGNRVKVKPKVIVSVTYQNIQGSPTYNSGFAMRFPRITNYRPDRSIKDIATLEDIKREAKNSFKGD